MKSREERTRQARLWRATYPDKVAAIKKRYHRRHPDADRRNHLRRVYNLSWDQYQAMLRKQRHRCAICRAKLLNPKVDHDHEAKTTRGLLCHCCNLLLGNAHDNPTILLAAVKYLHAVEKAMGV